MTEDQYLDEDIQRMIRDFEDEVKIVEEERDKKIHAQRGELLIGELFATLPAVASIDIIIQDAATVEERIAEIEQGAVDQIDVLEFIFNEKIKKRREGFDV